MEERAPHVRLPGTASFLERLEQRRTALRSQLGHIFPLHATFVWELGCGHGHFLTAYAHAFPNKLCVGIDLMGGRIARALRKRDRAKLPNLFFVHAEARLFLEVLPAAVQFSELHVLFPDPWPKSRHHKHRIIQPDFLSAAAGKAAAHGRLYFRTDFRPYFADAQDAVRDHPQWTLTNDPWPFEFSTVFQSRAPEYQSLVARRS
jgi:tRNA (guanine-N7-)-methyltransferase